MQTKKRFGSLFLICGALFLAAALALTAYNLWDDCRAADSASDALAGLREELSLPPLSSASAAAPAAAVVPDAELDMPTVALEERRYLGILEIPSVSLALPVFSSCSSADLRIAPCRYFGSVYKNDLVIAGHNYRSHFGKLRNVAIGDSVFFTDAEGSVFRYAVIDAEILRASASSDMVAGDWDLTLFTCSPGGETRFTLRCARQ